MINLVDVRTYKYENEIGVLEHHAVKYLITLRNGTVENVFNEYHKSVEKNSEVFEYYSNKFNGKSSI